VVVRKNISRIKGEQALIEEIRYFFYFTTYPVTTHTPAQIVELANDRCDQENIHGQLKSGLGALRAPVDDLLSNWAYMLIAALAWNIKSWHAMMMHRNHDRHAFIRMEFKRFLDTVIRIPAMVIVRARALVVRLVAYTVNLDRFFSAWATTERTRFGYDRTRTGRATTPPPSPTATATPHTQHRMPTIENRSKRTRSPPGIFLREPATLSSNPHIEIIRKPRRQQSASIPNLAYLRTRGCIEVDGRAAAGSGVGWNHAGHTWIQHRYPGTPGAAPADA
jgi:hypothetical protein